jgi:hypothetical protein
MGATFEPRWRPQRKCREATPGQIMEQVGDQEPFRPRSSWAHRLLLLARSARSHFPVDLLGPLPHPQTRATHHTERQ